MVFNCQMGRGRTTTGMIIASLLHLRKAVAPFRLPAAAPLGALLWASGWGRMGAEGGQGELAALRRYLRCGWRMRELCA